ncbi:MAG: acetate kinase, partial [Chlorobi bacterium]|nr:acetate kinase [Chlorobiota bacterium]
MKILVLNAGSSSLKFELFDGDKSRLKGLAQRIGEERGHIRINDWEKEIRLQDHGDALKLLIEYMHVHPETAGSAEEIRAVGHRVVHGGSDFVRPVIIDEKVKAKIRELFSLAPLHNPANLTGIETAEKYFPRAVQVAVFDTAFHQSIPEEEHRYAIPEKYYREGIRQYGFHGISHQ